MQSYPSTLEEMDPETEYLPQSLAWAGLEIVHFNLSNARPSCSKRKLREKDRWLHWRIKEERISVHELMWSLLWNFNPYQIYRRVLELNHPELRIIFLWVSTHHLILSLKSREMGGMEAKSLVPFLEFDIDPWSRWRCCHITPLHLFLICFHFVFSLLPANTQRWF